MASPPVEEYLATEREALSSVYGGVDDVRDGGNHGETVHFDTETVTSVRCVPYRHEDEEAIVFVRCTLLFTQVDVRRVDIQLIDCKGFADDAQIHALKQTVEEARDELDGEPGLYCHLVETIRQSLTNLNVAQGSCVICRDCFTRGHGDGDDHDNDEVEKAERRVAARLPCFHPLHFDCLVQYTRHTLQQRYEEKVENEARNDRGREVAKVRRKQKEGEVVLYPINHSVPCPICRHDFVVEEVPHLQHQIPEHLRPREQEEQEEEVEEEEEVIKPPPPPPPRRRPSLREEAPSSSQPDHSPLAPVPSSLASTSLSTLQRRFQSILAHQQSIGGLIERKTIRIETEPRPPQDDKSTAPPAPPPPPPPPPSKAHRRHHSKR